MIFSQNNVGMKHFYTINMYFAHFLPPNLENY